MLRMQIQLTEPQAATLRSIAEREGLSLAATVRRALDAFFRHESHGGSDAARARALGACGRFASGLDDVADRHDDYFVDSLDA